MSNWISILVISKGVITVILSDSDEILCTPCGIKYNYNNSSMIAQTLEDIL